LLLADSSGNQLRVLPAEIQHNDAAALAHSFLIRPDLRSGIFPRSFNPQFIFAL
jgi:hypothetical protein